ncbi:MAG: carboxypeptidase regulatory-like domain-containing protein [Planctomycetota bacterium]
MALPRTSRALRVVALLCAASCGGGEGEGDGWEATELERRDEGTPTHPIDAASTGGLAGAALFRGTPPPRRQISRGGDCAGHAEPIYSDDVRVADGRLADVLVHVRKGLAGWEIPPAAHPPATLRQRGCRFEPPVVALRAGGSLQVTNEDPVSHNVRVSARRNPTSNRSQSGGAAPLEIELPRAELGVAIACDLHPWMGASVHALDHPFFALTGTDGSFAIDGLPPGDYEVEALHPTLGRVRLAARVERGETSELLFPFGEDAE